jgi:hypothetical protein
LYSNWGLFGQNRQRRVRAHGAERLHPVPPHGTDNEPKILKRVTKYLLPLQNRIVVRLANVRRLRQVFQEDVIFLKPLLVRMRAGVFFL